MAVAGVSTKPSRIMEVRVYNWQDTYTYILTSDHDHPSKTTLEVIMTNNIYLALSMFMLYSFD